MADVTNKNSLVFIHHIHTHKKTQNCQKTDEPDGKPVLCQRTFNSVFRADFYTFKPHSLTWDVCGPLEAESTPGP